MEKRAREKKREKEVKGEGDRERGGGRESMCVCKRLPALTSVEVKFSAKSEIFS